MLRFTLAFAFAASLAAQEKVVESIEVKVTNVDVIVTDRAGHSVTGLTKDDFEILENGKPQPITNFYEVAPKSEASNARLSTPSPSPTTAPAPGAATEDIRARRFVIMIDNYSLEPMRRNKVLTAARKFIDANLKPTDQATVVVWAHGNEVITPFTNDKAEIIRGLESIAGRSRVGLSAAGEEQEVKRKCREMSGDVKSAATFEQSWFGCKAEVNEYADSIWANEKSILAAIKSHVSVLAGMDGRKIFVLAGAALPQNPGRELGMWAAALFGKDPTRMFGEAGSRRQLIAMTDLARYASTSGVAFYNIDAADSDDVTAAESPERADREYAFGSFSDSAASYKLLSDITGGSALTGTQNFDSAFETLAHDLTSFYSLGYKPTDAKAGDRKITVRVKKPGLTARARQSFTPRTTEQEMHDRVVANLFREPDASTWPIKMTAGEPQRNGDQMDVPLKVEMDPNITLLPQGDKLAGGFTLYIVAGMKNGGTSKVSKSERKIEVPAGEEAEFRSRPIVFTLTLSVRPGDNIISVAVADSISDATGFDRLEVSAK